MISTTPTRGFTLLIAVVLSSVLVSISLSLIDIAYKQIVLASTATQSEYAFYNADTALECALYWDQKYNAFDYTTPLAASALICGNQAVTGYTVTISGGFKRTSFALPCAGGGTASSVIVEKNSTGGTRLYGNGYNTCATNDVRRIERGLKASYGF